MWTKRARMEQLTFKGTWDKHLLRWLKDLPTLWALNEKTLEANEPRSLKLMIGSSPKCPTTYLLCIRTLRISSRKASLWNTYRILVQILIQSHLQANFWSSFPIFFPTLSNLFKPKRHFGQSKSRNSRMTSVVRLYSDKDNDQSECVLFGSLCRLFSDWFRFQPVYLQRNFNARFTVNDQQIKSVVA